METHQQHLSMRDYGRAISKRWKVVVAFALLGLAVAAAQVWTSARAYQATSEVLVERPSGYSISAAGAGILGSGLTGGATTSTKQQLHFLETSSFQQIARGLTDIAEKIHLDMRDTATLDNISTVMQADVLSSEYVTPVRIALYDMPSSSLQSFQQAKVVRETPGLRKNLDDLAKMAIDGGLTDGWIPGRLLANDDLVRANFRRIANSPMFDELRALGINDAAANELTSTADEEITQAVGTATSNAGAVPARDLGTYTKVALAAKVIGILDDLNSSAAKAKKHGTSLATEDPKSQFQDYVEKIMTSEFVKTLEFGPYALDWKNLTEKEKLEAIRKAGDALSAWKGKHSSKEELVWAVSGKEVTDGADIIAISQTAPSAQLAATAANAMAAVIVWQDRMTKVASDERSVQFLTTQLDGAADKLRNKEDELTAFRKANKMLDADTQLKSAAEQAGNLEAQIGQTRANIEDSRAALKKTVEQLGGTESFMIEPNPKENPLIDSIKADLIKVETELAGLRAQGYTDIWPDMMNAVARRNKLQDSLKSEIRIITEKRFTPDPVHFSLRQRAAELAATQVGFEARETAIARLLGDMDGRFSTLPQTQADMIRLMRAQAVAESEYRYLNERLIDAKNNRVIRQGNARVISVASQPGKQVAPRTKKTPAIGLLIGLFLGCLCALALSSLDTHIRSAEDVQRELKLPVIAHLPAFPAGDALVVESSPASAAAEALRSLRSTIRFMAQDNPMSAITATAVQSTSAKSAVVANLAASLAQAGVTVTAVDADMRRPRLASFFGQSAGTGLSEALGSGQSASSLRQATRIPGLFLLPAGAVPANPAELLEGGRMAKVLEDLNAANDMVLIDTPPINAVSDAAIVSAAVDALFVVVESGKTQPREVRDALAKLAQSSKTRVLGLVIVGGDAPDARQYQRYAKSADTGSTPRGKA